MQPSDVNFTHARNFPFIFNVKLHACANIDDEFFGKIQQFSGWLSKNRDKNLRMRKIFKIPTKRARMHAWILVTIFGQPT